MIPEEGRAKPPRSPPGSNGFVPHTREFGTDIMEDRKTGTNLTKGLPEAKRGAFPRRSVLTLVGTLGAAAPFGIFGAARALTAPGAGSLSYIPGELPIFRTAANTEELQAPAHQLKIASNANPACTVPAPV